MSTFVKKRDGRKEAFDVEKIKKVIRWGIGKLDLNPLVLEAKFDEFIKDGISTNDIQKNLIYHSRILCSPEEPEWSIVAGRLEKIEETRLINIYKTNSYQSIPQILRGFVVSFVTSVPSAFFA